MPPKSPVGASFPGDKTFKVSRVVFSRMTRLKGYSGACVEAYTEGEEPGLGNSKHKVKSLVIVEGLHPKLIVDGTYFMTFSSGAIEGWYH